MIKIGRKWHPVFVRGRRSASGHEDADQFWAAAFFVSVLRAATGSARRVRP